LKLILGDCLEKMRDIPDSSVDMILADPPYGTTACKWDTVIPFEPMWKELKRVIKPNGAILLFGSEPFSSALRMSNIKKFKYDWIWDKVSVVGFANAKKMPLKSIENICVFYDSPPIYIPQGLKKIQARRSNGSTHAQKQDAGSSALNGGRLTGQYEQEYTGYPRQILRFPRGSGKHPTQKPVALLEYLIKTYTLEGETVLDFTMGAGSTGVACKNTNRNFIGIEKDDKYFEIARQRIGA
jgi:DNA modification methylase